MLPEDKKRRERERSIAKATAGADYSQHNKSVRAVKAEAATRHAASVETEIHENKGYQAMVRRRQTTKTDRLRDAPGRHIKSRDSGIDR